MSATTDTAPAVSPAPARPVPKKRRRRRIDWPRILLEGFFVTLGVLLALAADEWRQSYAERRHADFALASIREELHTNRDAVRRSLDYHLTLAAALREPAGSASAQSRAAQDGSLFSKGFVLPAPMLQTAWESARSTDALSNMEYADVLTLARIYEQQRTYEQQGREVGGLIYAKLFNDGIGSMLQNVSNLSVIISTFLFRECALLRDYAEVFTKLDGKTEQAPVPPACQLREADSG
jgi:hypothetical protein